jgi:hypothetical protein
MRSAAPAPRRGPSTLLVEREQGCCHGLMNEGALLAHERGRAAGRKAGVRAILLSAMLGPPFPSSPRRRLNADVIFFEHLNGLKRGRGRP